MKFSNQRSGVSLHFVKHKGNTSGINRLQQHNERVPGRIHSNTNINDELTDQNLILHQYSDSSYYQRISDIIENNRDKGLKGVRKDAVRMVSATVQLSGLVQDLDPDKQENVLRESYSWLKAQFGEQNIVSASIHKDETNIHLHFDFVPIDSNHKLNAKKLLGRDKLRQYQSEFLEFLQDKFKALNFQRIENDINGLSQKAFEVLQDERKELEEDINEERKLLEDDYLHKVDELNARESSLKAQKSNFDSEVKEFHLEKEKFKKQALRIKDKLAEKDRFENEREITNFDMSNELAEWQNRLEKKESELVERESKIAKDEEYLNQRSEYLDEQIDDIESFEKFNQFVSERERQLAEKDYLDFDEALEHLQEKYDDWDLDL